MIDSDQMKHRHPQIFDRDDAQKKAMEALEKENSYLKALVVSLSQIVIRKITGKTSA